MKSIKTITSIIYTLLFATTAFSEYFKVIDSDIGLDFYHNMGHSEDFYYPEIVGSGVALIDFDKDGDLDIYMVQSGAFENNKLSDQMYKNLLIETGLLKFENVTKKLALNNLDYGIGVAVADVNQDGWDDLFVANLHQNKLFLNDSGKRFKLDKSATFNDTWSASASFCDINNDSWPDLYVSNYVNWSETNHPKCYNSKSKKDYCGPNSFEGLKDSFYLNNKGTLENKTSDFFSKMPKMPGLNVICQDVNQDGWNDFIVANDGKRNLLWLNQSGKFFKESGYLSGLAVNSEGKPEASMGIASADFDVDGDLDIFFTHLMNESNTLYRNNSKGMYQDVSNKTGLSRASFAFTGWATGFLHVNNDIYPDLLIFNGAVADTDKSGMAKSSLEQSNQLFLGSETSKFTFFENENSLLSAKISRGAAFGDLDNDGDIDIVANNNSASAEIFVNQLNPEKWIGFKWDQDTTIKALLIDKENQTKFQLNLNNDGSYASSQDGRIIVNEAQIKLFDKLNFYQNEKLLKSFEIKNLKDLNKYKTIQIK